MVQGDIERIRSLTVEEGKTAFLPSVADNCECAVRELVGSSVSAMAAVVAEVDLVVISVVECSNRAKRTV